MNEPDENSSNQPFAYTVGCMFKISCDRMLDSRTTKLFGNVYEEH